MGRFGGEPTPHPRRHRRGRPRGRRRRLPRHVPVVDGRSRLRRGDLRLGTRPTVDELAGFDEVVVATGVTPRVPGIAGIDHPSVVTYPELVLGERDPGDRVADIGAGGIGVDTIVVCAGQEPERTLANALAARGIAHRIIGGADVAAGLDAKRAIKQGTELAAAL